MPNKYFAFIYESPWGYGSSTSSDTYNRKQLTSANAGRLAIVKELFTNGTNKTGFLVFAKVGVGQLSNYWIELDNAIESGETLAPRDYRKATPTDVAPASVADEILKFKKLLDAGAITQEEYNAQKKKLLNQ